MTVTAPSTETPDNAATEGDKSGLPPSNTDAPAASSTAPETGTEAKPTGEGDKAGDATKPKSVHEAVKAAMSKDKGAAPSAADAKTDQPKPETGKDGVPAKPDAPKADGESEVPTEFSKHPAWIRNAKDRDEAIKARDEFKVGADKWTRFNELATSALGSHEAASAWMNRGADMRKAGVNDQEQHVMTELAIAAKTDPQRAFNIIKPIYEALQGIVGETLPQDLQEAVDRGEMTEDAAKRLNKSEATARIETRRAAMAGKTVEERDAATATKATNEAMANAVYSWETRMAQVEPDWKRIAPLVNEQVGILREARQPKTPKEAEKLCDDAVALVKRMTGAGAAAKPNVGAPSIVPSNRQQEERPKSAFEAAKRGLAR